MSSKEASSTASEGDSPSGAQYPKATLEESLRVATAIESANGGQPYPPTETAIAMGSSPSSSVFRTLLSASSRRGLTSGAHTSKRISILETGRDIITPTSDESRRAAV